MRTNNDPADPPSAELPFVSVVIGIQVVASAAGLVGPQILEFLIDHVRAHQGSSTIDFAAGLFLGALVVQTVLTGAARALGARGERVTTPAELDGAIHRALDAGEPTLVDVVTDREPLAPVTNYDDIYPRPV